jgi:putative FmdB family regulatory protein
MPRYDYLCLDCQKTFTVAHGMNEQLKFCECGKCGEVERQLSDLFCKSATPTLRKVGNVVKEYIEQTKEDLLEEKRSLMKEYNDDRT